MFSLLSGGLFQFPLPISFFRRGLRGEQGYLPAQPLDLPGRQQGDGAVLPVEARPPVHLSQPQAADALCHAGPCGLFDIRDRRLPEDVELRSQLPEQLLIQFRGLFSRGGAAGGGGDDLRQRGQALKGLGSLGPEPRRTVSQGLHPVLHADGQFFAAHRAHPAPLRRLGRCQADAAVPVSVQVVLALLRKELDGPAKALPGPDGPDQLRIGPPGVQQIGLPPQLGGGVGVRVGDQGEAVQGGDPPVHGRVGGEPRLHRVNAGRQVVKAGLHGVEPGKGAEHGEVGRPDVGGDELRVRAGLQRQLQQVPAVQAQDGPPVGVDVADGLQPGGELIGGLQGGEQDQVVDLPGPAVPLVDGADLPGDDEPGRLAAHAAGQPQLRPQGVHALPGGDQLLLQLRPPGGMGEVPRAQQPDALPAGPPVQMGQVAVPAGGPGEAGVDVEIGDIHGGTFCQIDGLIIPLFPLRRNRVRLSAIPAQGCGACMFTTVL